MPRVRDRTRPSALLALLACGLGALIYYELESGYWERMPPPPAAVAAPDPTLPAPLPDFRMPPIAEFAATTERPLFLPNRRPPDPDVAPESLPEAAATPELNVALTGIVLTEEGEIALVRHVGAPEVLKLAKGDIVAGWSVLEILPDRVRFGYEGEIREIELKDRSAPPRPPAPAKGRPPDAPSGADGKPPPPATATAPASRRTRPGKTPADRGG